MDTLDDALVLDDAIVDAAVDDAMARGSSRSQTSRRTGGAAA
jgi:hypothetical protein